MLCSMPPTIVASATMSTTTVSCPGESGEWLKGTRQDPGYMGALSLPIRAVSSFHASQISPLKEIPFEERIPRLTR